MTGVFSFRLRLASIRSNSPELKVFAQQQYDYENCFSLGQYVSIIMNTKLLKKKNNRTLQFQIMKPKLFIFVP